jgi:Ca2+-transporting ATPase
MVGVALLTIVLQIAAVYVPFLDEFFEVVPLSAANLGLCVAWGGVVWGVVEIEKRLLQQRGVKKSGRNRSFGQHRHDHSL